jgi:holliday junction DNA helicase RuvA
MISRLTGNIVSLSASSLELAVAGITYELLISPWTAQSIVAADLSEELTLHTWHYLEGSLAGGALVPRLVGFLSSGDHAFFDLLRTVKGFGTRKALGSMASPTAQYARMLATGDIAGLRQLPEVGPSTAKRLVDELRDKTTPFLSSAEGADLVPSGDSKGDAALREPAMQVLTSLGLKRTEAQQVVARTLHEHPDIETADELVRRVLSGLGA